MAHDDQMPFDHPDLVANPEPRCAYLLLLDISGSMLCSCCSLPECQSDSRWGYRLSWHDRHLDCLLDSLAMILLTIPIVFPINNALGYDPIWFGIIIVTVVELGLITAPIGMNVFIIEGIPRDVPLATIFRGCISLIALATFQHDTLKAPRLWGATRSDR